MANQVCIIETDKIVNGSNLMKGNVNLVKWDSDLSNLVNGYDMFSSTSLTSFSCDLRSLVDGTYMFKDTPLTSFSGDLSNLTNAYEMFANTSLTSFSCDLRSLVDGTNMFRDTSLESFSGDLSSLADGSGMFLNCNLNADSVRNITLRINNEVTDNPRLMLGVNTSILTNTQTKNDFGVIIYKGWDLYRDYQSDYVYNTWSSQKYNGCTDVNGVRTVDSNYSSTDIVNGKWTEHLCDLQDGTNMFRYTSLESFSGDLSSLTNGEGMFYKSSLEFFSGDLSRLVNGYGMFSSTSLTSFNNDLSSLTDGKLMFRSCSSLTSFSGDLSSLVSSDLMFAYTPLESFSGDLSNLTNCSYMFQYCSSLASFSGDLSSLVNGECMFRDTSLVSFSGDLSNLTNGSQMFSYTSLASFSGDLGSLTNGYQMFAYNTLFESFSGDLGSLTKGYSMFYNTSLASFSGDLSNLTNGYRMFKNCKLNTESIKCISDTIKDVTELTNSSYYNEDVYKQIDIGIGNSMPTTEEKGYLQAIASNGWTVYVNGSALSPKSVASVMTLDEDGNEVEIPIPYYAKPIASDEEHAEYVDADGNYFNIVGAQFIYGDDLSNYGMFTCEEDAALNMGLTKIDK